VGGSACMEEEGNHAYEHQVAWRRRVTTHMSTRRRGFSETVDCSMAISCSEIKEEYTCDLVDRSCETLNIIEKCGQQGGF